jgi:2-amino-4-hydroxy-6-hydroxymethyldihydropteridine diphosphokinase
LGANLGDPLAALAEACATMAAWTECRAVAVSPVYRSAPVDADGPWFFNAVLALDTGLDAPTLLARLHALELQHGRQRPYRHAPRTLDLDLLLLDGSVSDSPALRLPHPRLHLRAFVLRPLLDIAPTLCAPGLGRLADHLPRVADQAIERVEAYNLSV